MGDGHENVSAVVEERSKILTETMMGLGDHVMRDYVDREVIVHA